MVSKKDLLKANYDPKIAVFLKEVWGKYCLKLQYDNPFIENNMTAELVIFSDTATDKHQKMLTQIMLETAIQGEVVYDLKIKKYTPDVLNCILQTFNILECLGDHIAQYYCYFIKHILVLEESEFIAATSPDFMGTIAIAPKRRWSLYDYIENIVHECAHMDLYMKQLIDPIVEGNAQLESVFRKKLRPQNAVFHSCYVLYHILIILNKIKVTGIEILNNDENKIELDLRIDRITKDLMSTIKIIKSKANLTLFGKALLQEMDSLAHHEYNV